jgi:hypothetical protein
MRACYNVWAGLYYEYTETDVSIELKLSILIYDTRLINVSGGAPPVARVLKLDWLC